MPGMNTGRLAAAAMIAAMAAAGAYAQPTVTPAVPSFELDGTVHVPAFELPPSMDMSPAIVTASRLLKAWIDSPLIVAEGMGHCYMYQPGLPESRDAYQATVAFFREHLR